MPAVQSSYDEIMAIIKEVWLIQKEISESQKETARQFKETDRKFLETDKKFLETARQFKETDRKFLETDKKFQETDKKFLETDKKFLETDKKFQDIRLEIKAMTKQVKETSASIGRLGNRLGDFVEEAVRPAAVKLFRERGIDVHEVQQNISVKRHNEALEIDLLVVNDKDTVVIECKSNLSVDDVNEHLARLEKVKRLIPRYKENRIVGAVAGMVIPEHVALYAIKKGLYVIAQNGEHLTLANATSFVPKEW